MFDTMTSVLDLVGRIRKEFDIDNVDALILAAVAEASVKQKDGMIVGRPVSAASVSERLQLPRETVRRRLVRLISVGLIEHVRPNYLLNAVHLMQRVAA